MKADRRQIERALDTGGADHRFLLLYGPDESGSRGLADRINRALGDDVERIDLSSAELRNDPARLADEAASISLFGGRRYIRVDNATDEMTDAAAALVEASVAGNPVLLLAGNLRKDSKLVKLALASKNVLSFASYAPEGAEADRLAIAIGRDAGLRIRSDVAARLVTAAGGDRAVLMREIDKFALYLDAAPDRPADLDHDALDALSASSDEGDPVSLVNAALSGRLDALAAELAVLGDGGGIGALRAVGRRLLALAPLVSEAAQGNGMGGGGKAMFQGKQTEADQARRWDAPSLARAIERVAEAERAAKLPGAAGNVAVSEELYAIARVAARRGR